MSGEETDMARMLKLMRTCAMKMKKTAAVMRYNGGLCGDSHLIEDGVILRSAAFTVRTWIREIENGKENGNDKVDADTAADAHSD